MSHTSDTTDSQITTSLLSVMHLGSIGRGFNPRQQLMDLVNRTSIKQYSLETWDFTDVGILPNGSENNTKAALINTVVNSGLYNKRAFNYNRIHVSDLGVIRIPKGSAVRVTDMLDQINAFLSTWIYSYDIIDGVLPDIDVDGNVTVNLAFEAHCLQFYSSAKVVLLSDAPVTAITKADVGLPLVDNTPDLFKPVSAQQQAAIADSLLLAKAYTQNQIAAIPPPAPAPTPAPSPSGGGVDPTDFWHDQTVDGGNF